MLHIADSSLEEIADVCRLDKLAFSEKWDIPLEDGVAAWIKNKEIYRVIKHDSKVMGYHFVAPFSKEIFDQILSGQMDEKTALPFMLKYSECKEAYFYLYSIVVDISVENYKIYSKPLVQDLVDVIKNMHSRNIEVMEFGFIAITDAGVRLARRMGLTLIEEFESDEKPNPQAFRSAPKNFKKNSLFNQIHILK
jgi:hypothetical protein